MAMPTLRAVRRSRQCFVTVTLAVLACYLVADLQASDLLDGDSLATFAVPGAASSLSSGLRTGLTSESVDGPRWGVQPNTPPSYAKESRTARPAAAVSLAEMYVRCVNAMGAGAVASVIQAALSAVGEPIVNRVLVKRMTVMQAVNDVSAAQMLNFFKTTLTTNFLKFPFFELITAFTLCLPLPAAVRGICVGFVFTTLTLPVTNYRYRKSMELPVEWGNIYEAYLPTVIRDMVYGIARNYLTAFTIGLYPTLNSGSPSLLFPVVIGACLISAPFNEWRGYLLQSKGKKLTFEEFFKPSNFVRSTSLGAIKQGVALAIGYWCAPPVREFVNNLLASFK